MSANELVNDKNTSKKYRVPFFLVFMFIFYVFQVPIGLLRLYRFNNLYLIWTLFGYIGLPLFTLIMIFKFIDFRRFKFDGFSLIVINMCIFGFLVGLINKNDILKNLIDTGRLIFVLLTYIYFSHLDTSILDVSKYFKYLSDAMIVVYGLAVVFTYAYAIPAGLVRYLSLGSEMMFVPVAYNFWHGKKKKLFASIIIVILSVKRGVIVSMAIMLLMMMLSYKEKNFLKVVLKALSLLIIAVIILYIVLYISYPFLGDKLIFLKRWETLMPWTEKFSIKNAGSGRLEEISSAINDLKQVPLGIIAGGGSGFSYTFYYESGGTIFIKEGYRNVHVSPISIFILYGLPLTICFYFGLFSNILKTYLRIHDNNNKNMQLTIFYTAIGMLCYTMFVFELLQEPILWCALGLISGIKREIEYNYIEKHGV